MKITNFLLTGAFCAIMAMVGCKDSKKKESNSESPRIERDTTEAGIAFSAFKDTIGGKFVGLYVLKNKKGMEAVFTNYGQHLVSLMVPDKKGHKEDVVLGFSNLEDYKKPGGKYMGSVIGRYGNRIAGGTFTLDGKTFTLAKNNGENHLHGGEKGFESVVWDVDTVAQNFIRFHRISPDMEEGYPGNLDVTVEYRLTNDNALHIDYYATTDKKTHVNLTQHSFFNLKGAGNGNVLDHLLEINADHFNAVDEGLIPTGELTPVAGTPFDFKVPKLIGKDMGSNYQQIKMTKGYDHNFILNATPKNKAGQVFAARVTEPESGRVMEVYTNEPGVQIYTGNFMDGTTIGKKGKAYEFQGSICLETQHFPDSPNQPAFPSTVLEPGKTYHSSCVYKFSTVP